MSLKALLSNIQSYYQDYTFSQKYPANSQYATKPQAIAKGDFDQKTIPYGYDQPGGGWSGQPYVRIPFKDSFGLPLDDIGDKGLSNDMFIRGGATVYDHIKNDEIRIGNFFKKKGVLFVAQQNLLLKSSPVNLPNDIYPIRVYNPANTLVQIAGNAFGSHTNKLGVNPFFYDSPHGEGQNSYGVRTFKEYNGEYTNRLTLLYQSKILEASTSPSESISRAFGIKFNDNNFVINTPSINITRDTYTNKTTQTLTKENGYSSKFSTITSTGLSQIIPSSLSNLSGSFIDFRKIIFEENKVNPNNPSQISGSILKSFLAQGNYQDNNLQSTFGIGDPGKKSKLVYDITVSSSGTPGDTINLTPIYTSNIAKDNLENLDLVPFYFQVVNNDDPSQYTFIHLRAYLDNFSDNFTGNWQSFRYSGRGENFYIYDNFQRTINVGFTVAIESRAEQKPQYEKINYLASLTAPDYSQTTGFMRGNFVKLTVGNYLNAVPGFIGNLTYTIDNNVPWDIARDADGKLINKKEQIKARILPMVITVSMTFTPVHNFVPRTGAPFVANYP
jgi:hypothetical protein